MMLQIQALHENGYFLFPCGLAVVTVTDHPQRQVHTLGIEFCRHGGYRHPAGAVVAQFFLAVGQENGGVRCVPCPGHHGHQSGGSDPQTGGQACGLTEDMVIGGDTVQSNESTHGGTGQGGMIPVRQCAEMAVHIGF